jgi:hypothetical protein
MNRISTKTIVLLILFLLCFATSLSYIISPVTKEEMIEIAKSNRCPIRLNFRYGDDIIRYYDFCINNLKDDFSKLSNSDKADVVISFVLYGNLDAGASESFADLIQPFSKKNFEYLDTIQDKEIRTKFNVSQSEISNYHKKLNHYKNAITD